MVPDMIAEGRKKKNFFFFVFVFVFCFFFQEGNKFIIGYFPIFFLCTEQASKKVTSAMKLKKTSRKLLPGCPMRACMEKSRWFLRFFETEAHEVPHSEFSDFELAVLHEEASISKNKMTIRKPLLWLQFWCHVQHYEEEWEGRERGWKKTLIDFSLLFVIDCQTGKKA